MNKTADVVEIRNSQGPTALLFVALKLGFGLLLLGGWVVAVVRDAPAGRQLMLPALGFVAIAFGLFELRTARDRDVKVTLSPEGLRDFRARGGELTPWSQVRMAAVIPGSNRSVHFTDAAGNHFQVEIASLDISAREFIQLIKRYAPHVEVRGFARGP